MLSKVIAALLLIVSKICNIGMHSGAYEVVLFKLGLMIDTTEGYILIQV